MTTGRTAGHGGSGTRRRVRAMMQWHHQTVSDVGDPWDDFRPRGVIPDPSQYPSPQEADAVPHSERI